MTKTRILCSSTQELDNADVLQLQRGWCNIQVQSPLLGITDFRSYCCDTPWCFNYCLPPIAIALQDEIKIYDLAFSLDSGYTCVCVCTPGYLWYIIVQGVPGGFQILDL